MCIFEFAFALCSLSSILHLELPKRDSAERFPELDLELNNVRLIDARMFSMALVNSGSNQWREFFRITMPREKVARREHIAYIMRNELERRRRGVATFGGGRRVSVTDLMVTPLYATHRKAYARELKKNFKTWPLMVAEAAEDIEKSLKHRLLFVENVLRFGQMQEVVKEFRKQNQEWVNERLKVTDIHKQIILGKKVIESLNKQRPFQSAYHLASELHELPASVGHSVFFCIAQKDLTLSIGKEEIVRKSPGEWQHNWKMQTMHRDMEHRLMDNSIQNPLQEKQLSELEAAQRIADEVDRRIALLNNPQQIGTLCSGKFDEFSQYYRDVFSENPAADYAHNEMIRMIPTNGGDPYDG
ncbi:unnamed protein product [Angiostrongylus costaricensis]|uniref:Uncharacterized protein n=1 Tax=Angiostrongylus costaricensis TaxID=334426 RepID=A0A158PE18_ANGCS|nr:unnamed protein product [Angiostrongylus costaricensis]